jgi:hypothetical protein
MLRTKNLTLSATPVEVTIDDMIDTPNTISIQNTTTSKYAYLGGPNVSTTNYGFKLYPGQAFQADLAADHQIWAVGDEGTTVAAFIIERTQ